MASSNARILAKNMADAYFGSGSFKFLLATGVPSEANLDAWDFRDDITNEVASGGGYTTGGATVTPTVSAVDAANNRVSVTFSAPAAWSASTITAVGGWLYKAVGTAATDQLIGWVEFAGSTSSTGGTFTVTFSTPLYVTVS